MTIQHIEFDALQEHFEITFGLGIDFEADYERFLVYVACGGQEGECGEADIHHLEASRKTIAKVA